MADRVLTGLVGQALRVVRDDIRALGRRTDELASLFFHATAGVVVPTPFGYGNVRVYRLRAAGTMPSTSAVLDTGASRPLLVYGWLYDGSAYHAWPYDGEVTMQVKDGNLLLVNSASTFDGEDYDITVWYTKVAS